jgi:A/G-specific adenine glycosylase
MNAALQQEFFTRNLLTWHECENNRDLPWKHEQDPYKIWLSEIILQQTRAEQGMPYYQKFVSHFPTVQALAGAPEDEVMRLWQGLGYYSRCRNLLKAARIICEQYDGIFPKDYKALLALPGVGAYTAAAIASFAFGLPHAVVDGNVYRLLSRYFGIELAIDGTKGKKAFSTLAQELLDKNKSASYNQAIMDFGAVICKPQQPLCASCILSAKCIAYKQDLVDLLPVKEKKLNIKTRHFHYFWLEHKNQIFISLREEKDIWQQLYEPYLIETKGSYSQEDKWLAISENITDPVMPLYQTRQRLTHQLIHSTFYYIKLKRRPPSLANKGFWVEKNNLKKYAFPKTIISFFNGNVYF